MPIHFLTETVLFKVQNYRDGEQINGYQRLGMVEGDGVGVTIKGHTRQIFVVTEYFCVLIAVVVPRIYTCNKMV